MADWTFKPVCNHADGGFIITRCTPSFGDAFSPTIPSDSLCTLNWNNSGTTKVYSANMDHIGDYVRGDRMSMGSNPDHMTYGKVILIAGSDDIEYYCLSPKGGSHYMDGEVFELQANESKSLADLQGKHIFVSDGDITSPAVTSKHGLLSFETTNTAVFTAGSSGAVIALFYKRS